ncbi:flavodoxin domain-containing protein [uncultured Cellulomonas sp.]|uniref:flavodoxin family protein n=1 Tax=uncultured Cellulomonas sp. TaxID=189682 RepID=UPI0028E25CA6|nr:flavodoxin domain-containing protein [uncultured Cellulomonas sp.]
MRVLIVVESSFGNTRLVAQAVADQLRQDGAEVELVDASSAGPHLDGADLVLAGAPTHNLGLPTPASRASAVDRGAPPVPSGLREWIGTVEASSTPVLTFATRVPGRFSGSASNAAAKLLRRRGLSAQQGTDFVVAGTTGPLTEGETDRARAWAASLRG